MYLKSLDIQGFKSFPQRTRFEFHRGVTGIVGPNGCGKSNVVDAIRWVLGETSAKALRGGEMADVIFNGTEKRKPLGMAEVTLTLTECGEALKLDFEEVAITRRVFREGRGEYLINGTLCRLKDIHELFADTGIGRTAYSIMAQGQIDQILSSKPEERRVVFEEAAGITKFKREKREALRKLEYTEANLLRVSDVLAEQERRMNSLKRQVSKARRYQALAADVRVLDTHFAHKKFVELNAEFEELRTSINGLVRSEERLRTQEPGHEQAVAEARHEAQALESELSGLRQQLGEHRNTLSTAEGRIAFNEERKTELQARIQQNVGDIEATRKKLAQQEFDFQASTEALEELGRRIREHEARLAEQEEKSLAAGAERERIEQALRDGRTEANRTQNLIASTQARIESALSQLEGSRERARQLAEEQERLDEEIKHAREERDRIAGEVEGLAAGIGEAGEQLERAQRSFQRVRGDLDATTAAAADVHKQWMLRSSRHEMVRKLLDHGEGFEKGTRQVLGGLGEPERFADGIHGALAGFLEADDQSARAIEAALHAHLQAVLVTDTVLAGEILGKLQSDGLGHAALLPADLVGSASESQMMALPDGAVAWALDRVKADPRVLPVVESLLEQVLIVPDLKTAFGLRPTHPGVSFATLAGEWLGAEGVVRGGRSGDQLESRLELQNEARALEAEVAELQAADEAARRKVGELEQQLGECEEEVAAARDRLERRRVECSTREGELGLAGRELETFEAKLENVAWERGELDNREKAATENRRSLENELKSARDRLEELDAAQQRLQSELEAAMRRESELAGVLQEARTALAVERRARQAAEEQQRPMEARLLELRELSRRCEEEISGFEQRIAAATEENEQLAVECEERRAQIEKLDGELDARSASRGQLEAAIDTTEEALARLRREIAHCGEQKGREEVAATKLELRLENLVETMLERHQTELATFEPDTHTLLACIEDQKKQASRRAARAARKAAEEAAVSAEGGEVSQTDADSESPEPEAAEADADEQESAEEEIEEAIAVLPGEMEGAPDWSFVESVVTELRRKLDSMGPVNVDAIEEFEELEERHTFVRNQHDDLVNSKTELRDVIERINVETRRRFAETFEQVKKNFRTVFRELFGSQGKADLMLVDEDDPLESGIEVIAKPPGKKLQSITLLSGGERSMTAVALLFSIYMIKPSPFCVLDELDAPLDEANIGRFLKVLDSFIENSQFIIVTHNKRTMARVDVMYGVTMEEFGISKHIGMRLTAAEPDGTAEGRAKAAEPEPAEASD
jgi:chromosome segregation protein